MTERLDAVVAREYTDRDGNKKSSFTKIGAAFAMKNGGWSLSLDALPLPTMGERGLETRILLMVPKPRDDAPRQSSGGRAREIDDEIQF